jgi:hypothetical protein
MNNKKQTTEAHRAQRKKERVIARSPDAFYRDDEAICARGAKTLSIPNQNAHKTTTQETV